MVHNRTSVARLSVTCRYTIACRPKPKKIDCQIVKDQFATNNLAVLRSEPPSIAASDTWSTGCFSAGKFFRPTFIGMRTAGLQEIRRRPVSCSRPSKKGGEHYFSASKTTGTSSLCPSRSTVIKTCSPGFRDSTADRKSSAVRTACPATAMIRSAPERSTREVSTVNGPCRRRPRMILNPRSPGHHQPDIRLVHAGDAGVWPHHYSLLDELGNDP